ncbi:hypothetical protein EWM64_g7876 [Hericium alpestre]|uniref:DNA polymerase alpha subunit B N-terminal domain-containing protein n=1 Tax=Hericium alpestre TaxID=135208 RepID=A0A4Y9ZPE4_9AGAM|nr:hypothetical protein EWM64_g7876 [Hericium alpestre]
MSSQSIREDLLARFASVPGADDAFIDQCVNLCITYNLSGESLYYKWESLHFSASSRSVIAVTAGTLDTLRAQLKRELTNAQLKAAETAKVKSKLDGVLGMGSGTGLLGSRFKAKAHVGLVNARPEGTGVTDAFMSAGGQETARTRRVVFEGPTVDEASKKRREFRYMYEKISERSEVLDDRLDEIGELVREHYGIPELSDPSASTDHDVVVVGRITLDSDASSTVKLNESSLCLESSRMMGSGSRIPLKFDTNVVMRGGPKGQSSIGMFPGAIVAFKGRNGGVGWFSVSEILTVRALSIGSSNFLLMCVFLAATISSETA